MSHQVRVLAAEEIFSRFTRFQKFAPGEVIIQENETDDRVYFILSGVVKVTNFSLSGREIWHSELSAGEVFGELAALTAEPRSVSITAVAPARLAILTKAEFFDAVRQDGDLGLWMLEQLACRLKERTERVNALVAQNLSQRIRAELLRLAQTELGSEGLMVIRPVPNFTQLARRLNTDRENVSREVSALVRKGAIRRSKEALQILNRDYFEHSSAL